MVTAQSEDGVTIAAAPTAVDAAQPDPSSLSQDTSKAADPVNPSSENGITWLAPVPGTILKSGENLIATWWVPW
jgi:hypothetical protein